MTEDEEPDLVGCQDGAMRCWWAAGTPLLERYHDTEWGRGRRDETTLFERLSLEAFQAGLSWRIVLERRDALKEAFCGFEPEAVARFTQQDVERLVVDRRIIRNRAKIVAIVENARLLVRLHDRGVRLHGRTEAAIDQAPEDRCAPPPRRRRDVPTTTRTSILLASDLRRRGWRFIGPTTAYAYLQATGWVDDHLVGCHARTR